MTDERRPPAEPAGPDDAEPVSGDLVESTFEVDHGTDLPDPPSAGDDVPGGESGDPGGADWVPVHGPDVGSAGAVGGPTATGEDDEWPWGQPDAPATASPAPEPVADEEPAPAHSGSLPAEDLGLEPVTGPTEPEPVGEGAGAWDPPLGTDAMFGPGEYRGEVAGRPATEAGGFGAWHEGLEPFPDDDTPGPVPAAGTSPVPSGRPADPAAVPEGPNAVDDTPRQVADPTDDVEPADVPPVDVAGVGEVAAPAEPLAWGAPSAGSDPGSQRAGDAEPDELADWATFTDEHYIRVSQPDYLELADLGANEPDAAPSAVAASIPGLESGVVGLEDVADEPARPAEPAPASRSASDLGLRALTALALLVVFAAALVHPLGLTVVAVILFALAAGEFYAVLVRSGQHPLSLFGLLGAAGGLIGSAVWGVGAVAVAIIATLVAVALYYALTSTHSDPLTDGGLTVMVVAWVLLGAFVFPIVDSPDFRWWIAAVVIVVVVMDVGQYFVGRSMGAHPLAPVVSPKKTVEGLFGGAAATVVAAVALSFAGPLTLPSMLALAGATIVLAPLGDLSVSLVKRIIGVKDMGTILPGHGGILDRIDSLLFVVPAAWVIFDTMGLLG